MHAAERRHGWAHLRCATERYARESHRDSYCSIAVTKPPSTLVARIKPIGSIEKCCQLLNPWSTLHSIVTCVQGFEPSSMLQVTFSALTEIINYLKVDALQPSPDNKPFKYYGVHLDSALSSHMTRTQVQGILLVSSESFFDLACATESAKLQSR